MCEGLVWGGSILYGKFIHVLRGAVWGGSKLYGRFIHVLGGGIMGRVYAVR